MKAHLLACAKHRGVLGVSGDRKSWSRRNQWPLQRTRGHFRHSNRYMQSRL